MMKLNLQSREAADDAQLGEKKAALEAFDNRGSPRWTIFATAF
jgi:hypothetical protein